AVRGMPPLRPGRHGAVSADDVLSAVACPGPGAWWRSGSRARRTEGDRASIHGALVPAPGDRGGLRTVGAGCGSLGMVLRRGAQPGRDPEPHLDAGPDGTTARAAGPRPVGAGPPGAGLDVGGAGRTVGEAGRAEPRAG